MAGGVGNPRRKPTTATCLTSLIPSCILSTYTYRNRKVQRLPVTKADFCSREGLLQKATMDQNAEDI